MQDFDKVLRLGSIDVGRKERAQVYCHVQYKAGKLSVTGVEGPRANGDAWGSCGQIEMSYRTAEERDAIELAPHWTRDNLDHFFAVWNRYHLNDMQAGSPAQTAILAAHADEFSGYPLSHYDWAKELLAREGFQPDPSYLHNGEPYSYGSAWLSIGVPEDVLRFLYELPDTDYSPAWV